MVKYVVPETMFFYTAPLPDKCSEYTLQNAKNTLVITNNYCPCYLETLKKLKPKGVVGTWDETIEKAITQIKNGEKYLSQTPYCSPLTRAERQVLRYNALGMDATQIGAKLGCSENTVKTHIRRIYSGLRLTFPFLELENSRQLLLYWRGEWQFILKENLIKNDYLKMGSRSIEDILKLLENPEMG